MIVVKKFGTSVEYIWDKYKFIDRSNNNLGIKVKK